MLDSVIINLKGQQLQTVYQGLDELPGKVGRPVFLAIAEQVQRQIDADEAATKRAADAKASELAAAAAAEAEHPSE
jgi:hypothetical protein